MIYEQQKGSRDSKEDPLGQIVRTHKHKTHTHTEQCYRPVEASREAYRENCRQEEYKGNQQRRQ